MRENEKMMFIDERRRDVEKKKNEKKKSFLVFFASIQEDAKTSKLLKTKVEVFSKQKKPLLFRFSRAVLAAFFCFLRSSRGEKAVKFLLASL